jgi:hypothetical protein
VLGIGAAAKTGYSASDELATKTNSGQDWSGVAARGWIPTGGDLERTSGSYVAFTRPPDPGKEHTLDARNIEALASARNAEQKGPSGVISSPLVPVPPTSRRVRIKYSRGLRDVSVAVAGQATAEAAVVKLVPFQAAAVAVTPNGARRYRATAAQPGRAVTVPDGTLQLRAGKVAAGANDYVELSRFYKADADNVAGIGPMHLASDVDVAVRRFRVEITDRLELRAAADPTAATVAEARAGDTVFLLVPAPRFATPPPTNTGALPVAPAVTPEATVSDATRAFLGADGVAYRIALAAQQPPEQDVTVELNWTLGASAADSAPVKASLTLKPHFELNRSGGGGFDVARGTAIALESSDGTAIALEGAVPGLVTTAGASPSQLVVTADAAAATGPRTILVRDTANAARFARRRVNVT